MNMEKFGERLQKVLDEKKRYPRENLRPFWGLNKQLFARIVMGGACHRQRLSQG